MATSTTNAISPPMLPNGVTTVFPFTFDAPTADEVAVVLVASDGTATVVDPANYDVTLNAGGGGSVSFFAAPASGPKLFVLLDPSFAQEIEFTNGAAFIAAPVNESMDRAAYRDRALSRDVSRSIKTPYGEGGVTVPSESERQGKYWLWDADGNPSLDTPDNFAAPAAAAAAAAAASAAYAESMTGPTYASTAAGLAATTDGQGFAVDNGDGTVTVYLNSAGVAVEQRNVATVAYLENEITGIGALARPFTQRVMERLTNDDGDTNIVVFGDSTGNETFEWVYGLGERLAARFPTFTINYRLWDDGAGTYAAATNIQAGTGANVLTIWNASIGGTTPGDWIGSRYAQAIRDREPDLVFMSFGHNGGTGGEQQVSRYLPLVTRVTTEFSDTPVIIIGQNPTTTDNSMAEKVDAFAAMAGRMGLGFINIHAAFRQYDGPLADLMGDTVHPNAAGADLWADTVERAFYGKGSAAAAPARTPENIVLSAHHAFEDFAGQWTVDGAGLTLSKDTTNYETSGGGTKLTNASGAAGNIRFDILSGDDVKAVRDSYVTLAVRLKYTSGDSTAGRISIYDGVNPSVDTSSGGPQTGDFYWQIATVKVANTATYVRAYIYAATSTAASEITVDRVVLSKGRLPLDAMPPPRVEYTRRLRAFGSDTNGTIVARNQSTGARAISVLATTGGSDTDTPSTQYSVTLGGDICGWKGRSDTTNKIEIVNANSRISFGDGSAAPDMYIGRMGSALMAVNAAHLYPNTTGTHDLGIAGKDWRRVYATEYRSGGTKVVGAQQAAIANSVGGDELAKINAILAALRAHGLIAT